MGMGAVHSYPREFNTTIFMFASSFVFVGQKQVRNIAHTWRTRMLCVPWLKPPLSPSPSPVRHNSVAATNLPHNVLSMTTTKKKENWHFYKPTHRAPPPAYAYIHTRASAPGRWCEWISHFAGAEITSKKKKEPTQNTHSWQLVDKGRVAPKKQKKKKKKSPSSACVLYFYYWSWIRFFIGFVEFPWGFFSLLLLYSLFVGWPFFFPPLFVCKSFGFAYTAHVYNRICLGFGWRARFRCRIRTTTEIYL